MKFEITPAENARINKWLRDEVYPAVIAKQQADSETPTDFMRDCWEHGVPYQGAIGGGTTYSFSPTSIGMVTKVEAYGQTIDLTDYGSW